MVVESMRQTQYQIILELHSQADWVCGNAYRARYIFSSHKRRSELVKMKLCAGWEWRPCKHGFAKVRDYKLIRNEDGVSVSEAKIKYPFSEESDDNGF
jgi:hypothetical protein